MAFKRFQVDLLGYPAALLFVKLTISGPSPHQKLVTTSNTFPKPTNQRHLACRPIFPSKKGTSLINIIHYAEAGHSKSENSQKSP